MTMQKIKADAAPRRRRRLAAPLLAAAIVLLLSISVLAAAKLHLFDFSQLFGDRAAALDPGVSTYQDTPEAPLEAQRPAAEETVSLEDYHFQLIDGVTLGGGLLYARFDVSRADETVPDFPASGLTLQLGPYPTAWFQASSDGGASRIVVYALTDEAPAALDVTLSGGAAQTVLFSQTPVEQLPETDVTLEGNGASGLERAVLTQVGLTVWGSGAEDLSAEAVLTSAGGYALRLYDIPAETLTNYENAATEDGAGYLVQRQVEADGSFRLTWLFTKPFAPACQSLTFGGVSYALPQLEAEATVAQSPYQPVLGTSAETQDYRFTLEALSATPDSVCAVVTMEPLTDYGRAHRNEMPELVVSCATALHSGTSGAILAEAGETANRYLVYFVGQGPERLEAGDILVFELLSLREAGDTAERSYHLFDTQLEQVTEAVTAAAEGESRFTEVRLTPMTISLTTQAPAPGDHAAMEAALTAPEIVLTYRDGSTETILDGDWAQADFGQPGALACNQTGTPGGLAQQTYLLSLPIDLAALETVTIDGIPYRLETP